MPKILSVHLIKIYHPFYHSNITIQYLSFYMFCCKIDIVDDRQNGIEYNETPLQVKVIQGLGLKQYAINRYVFYKPPCSTSRVIKSQKELTVGGVPFLPPFGYYADYCILNSPRSSIPLAHFRPKKGPRKPVIIYSHGNGSDLSHSMSFIYALAETHQVEYLAYDFSGYGLSQTKQTNTQSICDDLQTVLAWLDRPLSEIILIGFSLGCYPTAKIASKYKVRGVVLISPMMSLISLLADERHLGVNTFFKNDELSILEVIQSIESHMLIMHSRHDELIPFKHSQILFERYLRLSHNKSVHLLEIQQIGHNGLLNCLQYTSENQLKSQFYGFLKKAENSQSVESVLAKKRQRVFLKRNALWGRDQQLRKKQQENKQKFAQKLLYLHLKEIRNSVIVK